MVSILCVLLRRIFLCLSLYSGLLYRWLHARGSISASSVNEIYQRFQKAGLKDCELRSRSSFALRRALPASARDGDRH